VACARQGAPPGGPPDRIPPYVVSTEPDTFAVVEPSREAVVFRFSERISERSRQGTLADAVVVSPETSDVNVSHSRDAIRISLVGGFLPGRVYRITLRPVIQDMFDNAMRRPFELVFSTGGEFESNVVAGQVTDRITGEPVPGARIEVVPSGEEGDTIPFTSVTDADGIYTLRYLGSAAYELRAYLDRNRDRELDDAEPRGTRSVALEGPADTVITSLSILAPDTTPARVVRLQALDSTALVLVTDDFLDPEESLEGVRVRLRREEGAAPAVDSLFHQYEWEVRSFVVDSIARVRADSLAAARAQEEGAEGEEAEGEEPGQGEGTEPGEEPGAGEGAEAPDEEAEVPQEEAGAPPPEATPGRGGGSGARPYPEGPPLAEQELYVLLERPLEPNVAYTAVVDGIVNINGVEGGGGESTVVWEPPPPEPEEEGEELSDTLEAAPDTSQAPPDTAGFATGSLQAPSRNPLPFPPGPEPSRSPWTVSFRPLPLGDPHAP